MVYDLTGVDFGSYDFDKTERNDSKVPEFKEVTNDFDTYDHREPDDIYNPPDLLNTITMASSEQLPMSTTQEDPFGDNNVQLTDYTNQFEADEENKTMIEGPVGAINLTRSDPNEDILDPNGKKSLGQRIFTCLCSERDMKYFDVNTV